MKKRLIITIVLCNLVFSFAACTKSNDEEVKVTEEATSAEVRGENYLEFQSEESVQNLETLKIEILDADGNALEVINIEKPKVDDRYCISPVITDDLRQRGTYKVIFTVNDTDTWERNFNIEECENETHINVIDIYEEDGEIHYESCLAM